MIRRIPKSAGSIEKISTQCLTAAVDFCLALTDTIDPVNTGFYRICCLYVGMSNGGQMMRECQEA